MQKFTNRTAIVKYMIQKKLEQGGNEDDLVVWKWLEQLLEHLGKDGMSSEESAMEEDGTQVYRVKKIPWRRNEASRALRMIDKTPTVGTGFRSKQGNKPGTRLYNPDAGDSRRPAPAGRPRAIYNEEWLGKQSASDLQGLEVSDEKFVWIEYYTLNTQ